MDIDGNNSVFPGKGAAHCSLTDINVHGQMTECIYRYITGIFTDYFFVTSDQI